MLSLPDNLVTLHSGEEDLREKALELIGQDARLLLHLGVVERAMDLADLLRQLHTDDEDLKVIQLLGMRTFNAFAASLKLALSGYGQTSALIMRDILETAFLIDLFQGDPTHIERWRFADKKALKEFSPVRVREALDARLRSYDKETCGSLQDFFRACGPSHDAVSFHDASTEGRGRRGWALHRKDQPRCGPVGNGAACDPGRRITQSILPGRLGTRTRSKFSIRGNQEAVVRRILSKTIKAMVLTAIDFRRLPRIDLNTPPFTLSKDFSFA